MGKLLIIVGFVCILIGLFITYVHKLPLPGKLPGDLTFEKGNVKIFVPVTTSIIISIVISIILYLYFRLKN